MSCNMLINSHEIDITGGVPKDGKYASFDTAFEQTPTMTDFEYHLSQPKQSRHDFHMSQQSEDKMDENIEEILNSHYKQNDRQNVHKQTVIEPFNSLQQPLQGANNIWYDTENTSYNATGMSFFKLLLLIILLVVLIYGGYWLYGKKTE